MLDVIFALTGLGSATMTFSEHHINGHDARADSSPPPHEDRYPSQISVGLSIQIPDDSKLVMYLSDHLELNPFNTAAELCESLPPEQKPKIDIRSARGVLIDDQDGDVVAFYGNKTWHRRRILADSDNLYFQFDDFDCEPLCGHPETPRRRADTLAALEGAVTDLIPAVSRRLDSVPSRHARHDWEETPVRAKLWGPEETTLTPPGFAVLRSLSGDRDVISLCDSGEPGPPARGPTPCVRWRAPASSTTWRSASIRSFERSRRGSGRLSSRADGARLTSSRHHIRTNIGGTHGRKAKVC